MRMKALQSYKTRHTAASTFMKLCSGDVLRTWSLSASIRKPRVSPCWIQAALRYCCCFASWASQVCTAPTAEPAPRQSSLVMISRRMAGSEERNDARRWAASWAARTIDLGPAVASNSQVASCNWARLIAAMQTAQFLTTHAS